MEKTFEYTWCDYLTECEHNRCTFVGDYDCTQCEHYGGHIKTETPVIDKDLSYKRYCVVYIGKIRCNYPCNK